LSKWIQTFIEIRRNLHEIPELGFQEIKTHQYLMNYIKTLPEERIEVKTWKTGIVVKVKGKSPSKIIGYRADMDGLPILEENHVPFRSKHEGYMHACGHDIHMSIALGVLTYLSDVPINDDVVFIFQPAEEGPGGALPLLRSGVLDDWWPQMIFALHIAPEYPVGTIATKEGLLFANTSELFIDLFGKGGHAAYPHQANDMVVAASTLVTQFQSIISRNINPLDSAVVTIGKITGGTVQNVIAEKARLEGTIRTLSETSMRNIKERIESLVRGIEIGFNCKAEIDYGSNYYQVYNDPTLTRTFMDVVRESKVVKLEVCQEAMTGEDFGYMLKEIPGFMFWLGAESEFGLHHSKLNPSEQCIQVGIEVIIDYLQKI